MRPSRGPSGGPHYGLFDLARLEQMILSHVAGDFFTEDEP